MGKVEKRNYIWIDLLQNATTNQGVPVVEFFSRSESLKSNLFSITIMLEIDRRK